MLTVIFLSYRFHTVCMPTFNMRSFPDYPFFMNFRYLSFGIMVVQKLKIIIIRTFVHMSICGFVRANAIIAY